MTFLNLSLLAGCGLIAIPIVLHLIMRRQPKQFEFPALRFVKRRQLANTQRLQLRHWLLLALRTLAVVFLVLLLANPIFQTGAGLFAGGGPVSLVVLLDNSLSMTWSGDGNGFKQAKDAARLLISALNDDDRAALLPTNITGKENVRLKSQKDVLTRELDAIGILGRDDGQPSGLAERNLGLLHEAEHIGVERERLVLIVDHDAGELDPHAASLPEARAGCFSKVAESG